MNSSLNAALEAAKKEYERLGIPYIEEERQNIDICTKSSGVKLFKGSDKQIFSAYADF